ncbi:Hypothetical protein NTJ_08886 [Nesidiocoris tenuis]|uniref:Uncharacterized protein n=1 Tax=Nesidiocoris tenuis TaxID=355587 RepID=A0ABN7AXI5_9HEMI|nr:Hypothetical protein NTJ_08886 [Nesidiocoris tenuis]
MWYNLYSSNSNSMREHCTLASVQCSAWNSSTMVLWKLFLTNLQKLERNFSPIRRRVGKKGKIRLRIQLPFAGCQGSRNSPIQSGLVDKSQDAASVERRKKSKEIRNPPVPSCEEIEEVREKEGKCEQFSFSVSGRIFPSFQKFVGRLAKEILAGTNPGRYHSVPLCFTDFHSFCLSSNDRIRSISNFLLPSDIDMFLKGLP